MFGISFMPAVCLSVCSWPRAVSCKASPVLCVLHVSVPYHVRGSTQPGCVLVNVHGSHPCYSVFFSPRLQVDMWAGPQAKTHQLLIS